MKKIILIILMMVVGSVSHAELLFTDGEGIDSTVSAGVSITVAGENASDSNKGIATFNTADFSTSSGDVTIKTDAISDLQVDWGTGATQVSCVDLPTTDCGAITVSDNLNPDSDGSRNLGTQTTAQWANVWADLVNGADIGLENGWRILESEKYNGYPKGIAIGFEGFEPGIVTPKMNKELKPLFVITNDWIEFKGVRITAKQLEKLNEE